WRHSYINSQWYSVGTYSSGSRSFANRSKRVSRASSRVKHVAERGYISLHASGGSKSITASEESSRQETKISVAAAVSGHGKRSIYFSSRHATPKAGSPAACRGTTGTVHHHYRRSGSRNRGRKSDRSAGYHCHSFHGTGRNTNGSSSVTPHFIRRR